LASVPPVCAIGDHGIIGDLHTVALVDLRGTIDFLCLPRTDGPSVFASLLDSRAGSFSFAMDAGPRTYRQIYVPDTNILVTRILAAEEVVEIIDFMVIGQTVEEPVVVRRVVGIRGKPRIRMQCTPAFGYASVKHRAVKTRAGIEFRPQDGGRPLALTSSAKMTVRKSSAIAEFTVAAGETVDFVLGAQCASLPRTPAKVAPFAETALLYSGNYWRAWSARSTYRGRYREVMMRSALALKLLVSVDHGSIAAAATFGLPEAAAGERNWDYRFSWVRDSSFAVYAFIRLGYIEEAVAFMHWIAKCLEKQTDIGPLQPMYRLDGSTDIEEKVLRNFRGYGGAKPVRIGNAAAQQLQLDVYGAFMDAVYLTSKYGGAVSLNGWQAVIRIIEWVCANWDRPDEGIWEPRNGKQVLLHSRMMCWVAVDRAIRLASKRSLPAPIREWSQARTAIHRSVAQDFWNKDLQSFVRSAGGDEVDASTLMMPLMRFMSARDPRWQTTQAQIEKHLTEDGLVYRYRPGMTIDGLPGHEGAFTTCSFWLVECLARQGETRRAQIMFEKILSYGNHVGLFAEEIGPGGEQMGNFPQALTHLALISSAFELDRALSGKTPEPWS
jgi:GH15 family glucan-1,4-alpha-glucosidase